jgi:4-amino-4-deoxy-L-arabinose transferase-like glycosyltransferase
MATALNRQMWWLLVALLLIGSGLRLLSIDQDSLWFDEVFSQRVAVGGDALSIAREGVAGDVHPPLYFMLLHGWVRLMGDSDFALRLLSVLTMILTLPAYYHLGRRLFDGRVGLVALALAVVSPLQINYSHEARQYALSIFFAAWLLVGFAGALRGRGWWLWLYAAALLGGLYTHYFTGFIPVALQLWLLVTAQGRGLLRRRWRGWVAANAVVLLLFLPQMFVFIGQAQTVLQNFWIAEANPAAPLATTAFLIFAMTLPVGWELGAMLLLGCLLALALLDMRRRTARPVFQRWGLCLLVVYAPLLLALAVSLLRSSIYLDRSFSLLEPALLVALAAAARYIRLPSPVRLLTGILLLLMLIGTGNHLLNEDRAKPPYRDIARALDSVVPVLHLHDGAYLPLLYYDPALSDRSWLPDLGEKSWLLPRTWALFGIERTPRAELGTRLATLDGGLQVVVPLNSEPEDVALFQQARGRACAETSREYPGVIVFTLQFEGC